LVAARQAGYKVFAVDLNYNSDLGAQNATLAIKLQVGMDVLNTEIAKVMVTERNQNMAEQISKLFSDHSCSKGILLVGSTHLKSIVKYVASQPSASVVSIQSALRSSGLLLRVGTVLSLSCGAQNNDVPGVATACKILGDKQPLAAVQQFDPQDPDSPVLVLLSR
jgi:hypothetical protein